MYANMHILTGLLSKEQQLSVPAHKPGPLNSLIEASMVDSDNLQGTVSLNYCIRFSSTTNVCTYVCYVRK